jgi:hypothetical protein
VSTLGGFRRWALDECPIAPGRKATPKTGRAMSPHPRPPTQRKRSPARRTSSPGKQDRLLALAGQRHDLTTVPLTHVSRIATAIGAEVSLSPGTARRVLLAHVRAVQNGHPSPKEHAS